MPVHLLEVFYRASDDSKYFRSDGKMAEARIKMHENFTVCNPKTRDWQSLCDLSIILGRSWRIFSIRSG
jgi:hypothetical protein